MSRQYTPINKQRIADLVVLILLAALVAIYCVDAISASTISRERSGGKRQSVVKDITRKRQVACLNAATGSSPYSLAKSK